MKVVKNNGTKEAINSFKTFLSIKRAADEYARNTPDSTVIPQTDALLDLAHSVCEEMNNMATDGRTSTIRKLIGDWLIKNGYYGVAKYYNKPHVKQDPTNYAALAKQMESKLFAKNVLNQNANMDERTFGGRLGEMSSCFLKQYALDHLLSDKSRNNHINNRVYIHDLDHYALGDHNCLTLPFDVLLQRGFKTRNTDVRGAKSVSTAFQLIAVLFQIQSLNQFGGVSASHLDWTLVPYVRYSFWKHYRIGVVQLLKSMSKNQKQMLLKRVDSIDAPNTQITDRTAYSYGVPYNFAIDQTQREIYQAVEGFYHNLNTLQSRSGNQLNAWLAM